jgi:error-prone DNA polymerase
MTVGYENPPIPWSELERKLSDRSRPGAHGGRPPDGDGGDSPAWSQHRAPYAPPAYEQPQRPDGPVVPYAELHAHSNFSFLDGASSPEDLVEEAVRLGLHALALTDHDGFYGAARLAETAASYDLATCVRRGAVDGLTWAAERGPGSRGQSICCAGRGAGGVSPAGGGASEGAPGGRGEGSPVYDPGGPCRPRPRPLLILTGCRQGLVRQALRPPGARRATSRPAGHELVRRVALFGRDRVVVDLVDHGQPTASATTTRWPPSPGRPPATVATGNVHYGGARRHKLARAGRRPGAAVAGRDGRLAAGRAVGVPAVGCGDGATVRPLRRCGVRARWRSPTSWVSTCAGHPRLPKQTCRPGIRTCRGCGTWPGRCGGAVRAPAGPPGRLRADRARARRDRGTRLPRVLPDRARLVQFAKSRGILCQGRGSAANSAVVYSLGITAVDSILYDLPSSGSWPRPGTRNPTSTWTSTPTGARR